MSQLYLTSSYIPHRKILSFEELSEFVDLKEVVVVFDTNLVIDYRDFFLSAVRFKNEKTSIYMTLRYLVEQIHRYELETNWVLGLDEATRRLSDFSRIDAKFHQTSQALLGMINASVDDIDKLILYNGEIPPALDDSKKTLSKVEALKQDFIGSQLLTVGYLSTLEIVRLKLLQEKGKISRADAYKQFLNFMLVEIDVVGSALGNYAFHLFGGIDSLRGILFKRKMSSSSKEENLHQIFNGAIDLIFPVLVNKINSICFPEQGHLIPVFATRDERIAELHSLCNTLVILGEDNFGFNFELVETTFTSKQNLCWTKAQIEEFKEIQYKDALTRWQKNIPEGGQKADHLLPKVVELERLVLDLI